MASVILEIACAVIAGAVIAGAVIAGNMQNNT